MIRLYTITHCAGIFKAGQVQEKYCPAYDYNPAVPAKLHGIIRLLNSLIFEGNTDGYGFQMHHSVSYPSVQQIRTAVERIAALNICLRVSEPDVTVDDNSENSLPDRPGIMPKS